MSYLNEREAFETVNVKLINSNQLTIVKSFVNLIKITYNFFKEKDKTQEKYEQFKKDIMPYLRDKFSEPLKKRLAEIDTDLNKISTSKSVFADIKKSFSTKISAVENLFFAEKLESAQTAAKSLMSDIDSIKWSAVRETSQIGSYKNPFFKEDPFIFQSTGLLRRFEFNDMEDLINKDLNKFKYSYLNFPEAKLHDFEYLVYYIQRLQDSDKSVEISYGDYNKWIDFLYLHTDYSKLKDLAKSYLYNNDKSLIPTIMKEMQKYSELVKTNEKLKRMHKEVYRGVSGEGEYATDKAIKKILAEDKKRKFVATSDSRYSALNFARQIGHLESGRRNKWGLLLTYSVTPTSILIDTEIFGSVYGESEILIDVTKAKLREYDVDEEAFD